IAQSPARPTPASPGPKAAAAAPAASTVTSGKTRTAIDHASARIDAVPGEPTINHYLRMMVGVSASDLHLSSDVVPMVRRHGEMQPLFDRAPISDREMRELLFEIIPSRNKEEFLERNDTDFAHTIEEVARFRANYFMDRKGPGAVFRQIPFDIMSPEKLGIPPKVLELCHLSKGLVLVTGPTGSGKSTTLATLIDVINSSRSDHIITIEDPIEFVHTNKGCLVNQREVGVHTNGFKSALRAALREDPDIVLVGEMRDLETIAIAIETAETGHLVFGTLHTTSAPSTVDRIIDQFPADRQAQIRTMLSESLRGVVAQMLCKKKGGGRVAAYEVLVATPAVANLIREGKTFQLKSVMQTGRALGMQTMNDHLIELVKTDKIEPVEAYLKSNDKQVMKDMLAKNDIKLDLGALANEH
ncbi:MAG: type IV pilus twitching motility protein PilT, partial [Myxococcota bacterium]|nr:type IV pilus twitching motility protein PilT [Myxococcota bacterium]